MKAGVITLFILSLSLFQCQKERDDFIDILKDAPNNLAINKDTLILDSYLWRDFQPAIIDPEDSLAIECLTGLNCFIKLIENNGLDIERKYNLIRIYIIRQRDYWETEVITRDSDKKNIIITSAGCGPHWKTGTLVDVVLEFSSVEEGNIYYLKVTNQEIFETS